MFKKITRYLFDEPDIIGFENYLVLILSFLITIVAILGTTMNIILNLGCINILSTTIPAAIFLGFYIYSRKYNRYLLTKHVIIILSLVLINIQWTVNFGTYGPIMYMFIVIQAFIILLFKKWENKLYTILILINVTILFYLEYNHPNIFGTYTQNATRLVDLYSGILIYFGLWIFLVKIVLSFYIREKEKAQQADNLKSSFLANMSHEIRTPMNAIIGFGDILMNTEISDKQKKYLHIINNNSAHLLKLIDDIIDLSKIESNQVKIIHEDFPINELFESLEQIMQQYLDKYNKTHLQLVCTHSNDNVIIRSDYTRIKQILTNLLSNAAKFTSEGNITYGYNLGTDNITFYVYDTGIGIPKKFSDEIFDRFKKVENSENEKVFKGAGLGLSISKQIVELLQGKMWVESEIGKGAKFYFTIPTKIIRLHKPEKQKINPKLNTNFTGQTILIVEDEEDNYNYLVELLTIHNLKPILAKNGSEAIELCQSEPDIKLILMDIKMPKMDGLTAAQLIKAKYPNLPIIAQTAYAMGYNKDQFLNEGFNDYISKPINKIQLIEILNQYLLD